MHDSNGSLDERPIQPLKAPIALDAFDANSVPPGMGATTAETDDQQPASPTQRRRTIKFADQIGAITKAVENSEAASSLAQEERPKPKAKRTTKATKNAAPTPSKAASIDDEFNAAGPYEIMHHEIQAQSEDLSSAAASDWPIDDMADAEAVFGTFCCRAVSGRAFEPKAYALKELIRRCDLAIPLFAKDKVEADPKFRPIIRALGQLLCRGYADSREKIVSLVVDLHRKFLGIVSLVH